MIYKLLNAGEIFDKRNLIVTPFPLINSIVMGMQEGKIFAIGNNFFIIHKSGFSYFRQNEGFNDYDALFNFLVHTKEIPPYFHVYDAPQKLLDACIKNAESVNIKNRKRVQLKYTAGKLTHEPVNVAGNFYIKKIIKENFSSLSVFGLNIDSKFWNSEEDFLQNGFGYCVFTSSHEPASVCYSASIAQNIAEIDVATLQPYQQKNLAKKVAYQFLEHCIENNIIANWDCFEDNVGSLKTANNIGFEKVFDYHFLSIYNKLKHEN